MTEEPIPVYRAESAAYISAPDEEPMSEPGSGDLDMLIVGFIGGGAIWAVLFWIGWRLYRLFAGG